MREQQPRPALDGPAEMRAARDGCASILMAVVTGAIAFVFARPLLLGTWDPPPAALGFVTFAAAGLVTGLAIACFLSRPHWIYAVVLLAVLERGSVFAHRALQALFGAMTLTDIPGSEPGSWVGIVLGTIPVVLSRPGRSPREKSMMAVLAGAVLIAALFTSRALGQQYMGRITQLLPDYEKWLGADVLVKSGPVSWSRPGRLRFYEGTGHVRGRVASTGIRVDFFVDERRLERRVSQPGQLEGLRVGALPSGLQSRISLPQPRRLAREEFITPSLLKSMGVRPELAARFRRAPSSLVAVCGGPTQGPPPPPPRGRPLRAPPPPPPPREATATYHGITYIACPDADYDEGRPWTFLLCSGTYSGTAR